MNETVELRNWLSKLQAKVDAKVGSADVRGQLVDEIDGLKARVDGLHATVHGNPPESFGMLMKLDRLEQMQVRREKGAWLLFTTVSLLVVERFAAIWQ